MINMNRGKQNQEGFTLIELMIVVAIIGVLAALAIYGVSQYLRHAKTAEATTNLAAIKTGALASFDREVQVTAGSGTYDHRFCLPASTLPTAPPAAQRVTADFTTGSATNDVNNGWICLKFQVSGPVYYSYSYTSGGLQSTKDAKFTAVATGDLNGDGKTSTFTLNGGLDTNGNPLVTPPTIVNEDE